MRANLLAWREEIEAGDIDAIITNASGCGTMVKDYGHLAAGDPELADIAATISAMTRDITEYLGELPLETIIQQTKGGRGPVTYHSACSLQHGQSVHDLPMQLLRLFWKPNGRCHCRRKTQCQLIEFGGNIFSEFMSNVTAMYPRQRGG